MINFIGIDWWLTMQSDTRNAGRALKRNSRQLYPSMGATDQRLPRPASTVAELFDLKVNVKLYVANDSGVHHLPSSRLLSFERTSLFFKNLSDSTCNSLYFFFGFTAIICTHFFGWHNWFQNKPSPETSGDPVANLH